ncbi:MAG: hypothetical protein CM15mP85_17960 [Rhodobacterales bacterium]|nr:MAG: hypothetical protein CM15mP85_17960 [Rhodobacterales bacterium]
MMVTWQWTPFGINFYNLTAVRGSAAKRSCRVRWRWSFGLSFGFWTLPHLARPIAIVVMIQAIFHLSLYAEIEIVSRGNGNKSPFTL